MKKCTKCGLAKDLSCFRKKKHGKDGKYSQCRKCEAEYHKRYNQENKELVKAYYIRYMAKHGERKCLRTRERYLQKTYNISSKEYDAMYVKQNGLCAICRQPETAIKQGKIMLLAVDHCHITGKARGLLCSFCNKALGYTKDNQDILKSMIEYLNRRK